MNKFLLLFSVASVALAHAQTNTALVAKDTVLASSAKVQVTREDLEAEMIRIPEKDQTEFLMSRTRLGQLVDNIMVTKTLAREATEAGLDKDPVIIAEIRNQTERVLAKRRGEQLRKQIKVADLSGKTRQEYLVNREKYVIPAKHVIWAAMVSRVGRTNDETQRIAEDILSRAKAGEDLEKLAKRLSDDATVGSNGGFTKQTAIENLEPNIGKVVKNLKAGDFGPIVKSGSSYFVVKLVETISAKQQTYEEVKGELLEEAYNGYIAALFENHISAIRKDPSLTVNIEAMEAVRPKIDEALLKPVTPPPSPAGPAK